jgi:hypothetical protein
MNRLAFFLQKGEVKYEAIVRTNILQALCGSRNRVFSGRLIEILLLVRKTCRDVDLVGESSMFEGGIGLL